MVICLVFRIKVWFGLKAETEGHAIRGAGEAHVGVAAAVDNAEEERVCGIRRTLPPGVYVAGIIFELAVPRLVVGVLCAFSGEGIAGATEDFDFR